MNFGLPFQDNYQPHVDYGEQESDETTVARAAGTLNIEKISTVEVARSPIVMPEKPSARMYKIMETKRNKRQPWTDQEDSALYTIIRNYITDEEKICKKNHWTKVAKELNNGRTGKQCRDRWRNHLRPNIKKGHWTKEEEKMIKDMHETFGTKWSCMAKLMKNRTDNDIKNKWYSMVRKEEKRRAKLELKHEKEAAAVGTPKTGARELLLDEGHLDQILTPLCNDYIEDRVNESSNIQVQMIPSWNRYMHNPNDIGNILLTPPLCKKFSLV